MAKRISWFLMVVLALLIGLYPLMYFFVDQNFGLLSSKPISLLSNAIWNVGFYVHIVLGGLALFIGWTQFNSKIRNKNLTLHRLIGKIYIISVMLSSIAFCRRGYSYPNYNHHALTAPVWLLANGEGYTLIC